MASRLVDSWQTLVLRGPADLLLFSPVSETGPRAVCDTKDLQSHNAYNPGPSEGDPQ